MTADVTLLSDLELARLRYGWQGEVERLQRWLRAFQARPRSDNDRGDDLRAQSRRACLVYSQYRLAALEAECKRRERR